MFGAFVAAVHAGAAPSPRPASTTPATAPTATPAPSPPPSPTPPTDGASTEIISRGQDDLGTLKGCEPESGADQAVSPIDDALSDLSKKIDDLRDQGTKASVTSETSLNDLQRLQTGWKNLEDTLIAYSSTLSGRGQALEAEAAKVQEITTRWKATRDATGVKDVNASAVTAKVILDVLDKATLAGNRINYRQKDVQNLQDSVHALLARVDSGEDVVDQEVGAAYDKLLWRGSPPIWSPDARPEPDLWSRMRADFYQQAAPVQNYIAAHRELCGVHLLVFLGLASLFLWLRRLIHRWTEDEPHLQRAAPIFDVPLATALAISFLVMGGRQVDAPDLLQAGFAAAALLPTVVILRRVLARRLFPVLYALAGFTVIDHVREAMKTLPATRRWWFCFEMAAVAGTFLWMLWTRMGGDQTTRPALGRRVSVCCRLATAIFLAALGASVVGYVQLGDLLGMAALKSANCAVFLYAVLRVLEGLIVITLRVRPVSVSRIARTYRDQVQTRVYAVFRAAAMLLWLRYALEQFQIAKPLTTGVMDVLTRKISLGGLTFSLDQLLWFGVAIWASLLISRLLRFFLREEVFERVQLAPGLPYAISTMLNYVVLLVGFLIALGVLGIPLTQITLITGALSVGLGFGLQNIINNFVSGIILLFERPVRVGDVIQFGDATGEVRWIGIRASIIRTRDGADIILPNGNLISSQVTNWTYGDRGRTVEVALNIATGPAPEQVVSLLKAAADRDPAAQDRPGPEVFVTGLLANGFTVVVRAWTGRSEDWVAVRSELNVTLHEVLVRENIRLA